jgi:hypothetical protein
LTWFFLGLFARAIYRAYGGALVLYVASRAPFGWSRFRRFSWFYGWVRFICSCLRPSHDLSYVVSPSLSAYLLLRRSVACLLSFVFRAMQFGARLSVSCLIPVVLRLHLQTRSLTLVDGAAVFLFSCIVGGLVACWMPSFRWFLIFFAVGSFPFNSLCLLLFSHFLAYLFLSLFIYLLLSLFVCVCV